MLRRTKETPATQARPPSIQATAQTGRSPAIQFAAELVRRVCRMAGDATLLDSIRASNKLEAAIRRHDTPTLFAWLMSALSYQGISDRVASGYMKRHGQVSWRGIERGLSRGGRCDKLQSYWSFHGCRYDKGSGTCAEPELTATCALPKLDLRNGRLNQTALSLFLFIRDIADGDFVKWLGGALGTTDTSGPDQAARKREAIIGPLRHVYGVSDKTLAMALSNLLLSSPPTWRAWHEAGASMVAVDTLVHNFLHRTGILRRRDAEHVYGPACYRPNGCAEIIGAVAERIDAREFNAAYPRTFPRFVQHAIWRYCAQEGLDTCNGNRVDDRKRCENAYCRLFSICERISLVKMRNSKIIDRIN